MSDTRFKELFTRHSANPIIQARDLPYQANAVFNAAATRCGDDTLLLMRVEDRMPLAQGHLQLALAAHARGRPPRAVSPYRGA